MTTSKTATAIDTVFAYHDRTKHHFHRYARSLGHLDWANQPDPFRRYAEAPAFHLPFTERDITPSYERLYDDEVPCQPLTLEHLSVFLENALAVSATKVYQGESWKLRCNPSSGNLHPTEGYVVIPAMEGLSEDPGVYHYAPNEHALEQRCVLRIETWHELMDGFPEGAFLAALTSIHWREAWKYGERAYRYCNHDLGHALAAYALSAASLGWSRLCFLMQWQTRPSERFSAWTGPRAMRRASRSIRTLSWPCCPTAPARASLPPYPLQRSGTSRRVDGAAGRIGSAVSTFNGTLSTR